MDDDQKEFSSPRNLDSTECRFDRDTHSVNITGQSFPHARSSTPMSLDTNINLISSNDNNNNNINTVNGNNTPVPVQNYPSFRDHIKSKASLAETFIKNLSRNNNNNSNNNFNHLSGGNCAVGSTTNTSTNTSILETETATENFSILQTNSKKILESTRKQHKYLAKRKILMHYNDELNEKRRKEMEKEQQLRYGIQHDANNNNEETLVPITTITTSNSIDDESNIATTVPTTPTTPTTPSNNNIKVRLLANHLNNNGDHQEADAGQEEDEEEEMEEEALNLAQNAPMRTEKIIPNIELVKIEPISSDLPDSMRNNNNNNNNDDNNDTHFDNDEKQYDKHEDNDNNNNNIEAMETDPNNNNSSGDLIKSNMNFKHATSGLLNIINRSNVSLVDKNKDYYDMDAESDNNNNNNKHNNNNSDEQTNDNNNNHSNQLDLSNINSVRNIATAEILCGLKSKVFKIEKERETCRNRNEIENAE